MKAGHRVTQVWVVASVEQYGVPLVHPEPEAAHKVCGDPAHPWTRPDVPRSQLKQGVEDMTLRLAPSHQCANCGEVFQPKDRIVEVYVVEGVAIDPAIMAPGIRCAGETEYAHKDCKDRDLSQGRAAVVLVTS